MENNQHLISILQRLVWASVFAFIGTILITLTIISHVVIPDNITPSDANVPNEQFDDSIDNEVLSLLADDPDVGLIKTNCTACHSARLIVQYRASREGWESVIRWMQATQKLWDLGENEVRILDYLTKHYAPLETGRRKPLENIEWYQFD